MSFSDSSNEKDDFWNIEKLVPKKKSSLSFFVSQNPARDYTVSVSDGEDTAKTSAENKLSFSESAGFRTSEEETYYPEGNGFIRRVKVIRLIDKYDFYDNFRKSALIYFDYKTDKCDFAQFFSYMPQYSQMNQNQKNYYFYWRHELRRGKYIKTDYSYLYLYVYEILNLPDRIPPEEGIKLLCDVWRAYRAVLHRLDLYFSIWIQDYCLVHKLPCPTDELSDFLFDIISVSRFKEFYLSDINKAGKGGAMAMLAYLSDYDWRRGKFVSGPPEAQGEVRNKMAEMYRTHMEGAMTLLLRGLWDELVSEGSKASPATVRRDSFPNSLCTHTVKSKLEIEYYPVSEAAELRRGITAAVRYTENKIRALMNVKSRLAVRELPDDYRRVIDYYFEAILDRERKRIARENSPEYEKLYDAPKEKLSFAGADEIERISWETTRRLVDTENQDSGDTEYVDTEVPAICEPETENVASTSTDADTYGLEREHIEYLASYFGETFGLGGGLGLTVSEDGLAERINEAFFDGFGDVVLENDGSGYRIIEDYYEDIKEWLTKILKRAK